MKNNTIYDLGKWKPVITYCVIWLLMYGAFFIFCPSGEMAYWMLAFWAVLPFAAILTAYKLGQNRCWTIMQIMLLAAFYGSMYMMIRYVTFGHHGTGLEWPLMISGVIFFLFGFVIGRGVSSKGR